MISNKIVDYMVNMGAVTTCIAILSYSSGNSILRAYHHIFWDNAQVRVLNYDRLCFITYTKRYSVSRTRVENCDDARKQVEDSERNDYVSYDINVSYLIIKTNSVVIQSPVVLYPVPVGSIIGVKYSIGRGGASIDRAFGLQDIYTIISTLLTCGLFQIPFLFIKRVIAIDRTRSLAKNI